MTGQPSGEFAANRKGTVMSSRNPSISDRVPGPISFGAFISTFLLIGSVFVRTIGEATRDQPAGFGDL